MILECMPSPCRYRSYASAAVKQYIYIDSILGTGHQIRGGGGATKWEGWVKLSFTSMKRGRHKKFWSSFNTGA